MSAAVAAMATVPSATARASGEPVYAGTANARVWSASFATSPAVVFDPLFDPAAGSAQAQVDSAGTSRAFAAHPHPGATLLAVPGLLGFATNGAVGSQLADYPLAASSEYPTTPATRRQAGAMSIEASSSSNTSAASAADGMSRADASVTFDSTTDEIRSRAETTLSEIRFGDLLSFHGVHTVAETHQSATGELVRASTFEIASLYILGQPVVLTGDVMPQLANQGDSLRDAPVLLRALLTDLAGRGITIEPFPEQELDDGVMSAGLRITVALNPPPQLTSGVERVVMTMTLGGNLAAVTNVAASGLAALPVAPPERHAPTVGDAEPGAPPAPPAPPARNPAPAVATLNQSGGSTQPEQQLSVRSDISIARFYPVLVLAGVALYVTARSSRYLGGRTP